MTKQTVMGIVSGRLTAQQSNFYGKAILWQNKKSF